MYCLLLVLGPLRFSFIPGLVPQPLSILVKGADFFTVEIRHWISSTLCSRVDAISDDMLVELAVSCLYEGHGAPMRRAPKC